MPRRWSRIGLGVALAGALLLAGEARALAPGTQETVPPEAIAADVLFARPAGLAATLAGAVVYGLALPFSLASGEAEQAARRLVTEPARFTFQRRLGLDFLP